MIPKRLPVKTTCVIIALLSLFAFAAVTTDSKKDAYTTWNQYGGGPDQSKYFEGSQITKENVKDMKVAWVYPSMDSAFNFFSPIVVDTIMYV
ncbi:MAG: quinoprotein glucose dehydrogenase, partial [Chitinophagaceae bacterium]|nr:quinoprotein glucose dehydrogenase [Chitinophagaceae bacterium]